VFCFLLFQSAEGFEVFLVFGVAGGLLHFGQIIERSEPDEPPAICLRGWLGCGILMA